MQFCCPLQSIIQCPSTRLRNQHLFETTKTTFFFLKAKQLEREEKERAWKRKEEKRRAKLIWEQMSKPNGIGVNYVMYSYLLEFVLILVIDVCNSLGSVYSGNEAKVLCEWLFWNAYGTRPTRCYHLQHYQVWATTFSQVMFKREFTDSCCYCDVFPA